jgi:CheY-like chemotaxis protein
MYMVGSSVTGPRRLLIVGDVALSRSLMRMVLTRLGYSVTCLASGQ